MEKKHYWMCPFCQTMYHGPELKRLPNKTCTCQWRKKCWLTPDEIKAIVFSYEAEFTRQLAAKRAEEDESNKGYSWRCPSCRTYLTLAKRVSQKQRTCPQCGHAITPEEIDNQYRAKRQKLEDARRQADDIARQEKEAEKQAEIDRRKKRRQEEERRQRQDDEEEERRQRQYEKDAPRRAKANADLTKILLIVGGVVVGIVGIVAAVFFLGCCSMLALAPGRKR
jgi:hypothetical protein